jgi:predicted O-methyltransferase YrrM
VSDFTWQMPAPNAPVAAPTPPTAPAPLLPMFADLPTPPTVTRPVSEHTLIDLMDDTSALFPAGDWVDMRAHLLTLYTLARYCTAPPWGPPLPTRPPLVLEIGVRQGVSTLALLLAMRKTGGRLISLDTDPVETAVACRLMTETGLAAHWEFHLAHSDAFAAQCPSGLDLLWIDGDHREPQPSIDFQHYAPKVREGALIVLHDAYLEPWRTGDFGVPQLLAAIQEQCPHAFERVVLPYGFGLVILRKVVP